MTWFFCLWIEIDLVLVWGSKLTYLFVWGSVLLCGSKMSCFSAWIGIDLISVGDRT